MMSIESKIDKIRVALTSIEGLTVYHYWRFSTEVPYCIWQEDGEDAGLQVDNHKGEQAISGTVDYFTKVEYDPTIDAIQEALNAVEGCSWEINSIQYEEETNLKHYEWRWAVI